MGEHGRPRPFTGPGAGRSWNRPGISFLGIMHLIFRIFFTTQLLCFHEALSCHETEYEIHGECCPKCDPGYRVSKHCTSDSSTSCKHCTKGTFTEEANGLSQCIRCQICDPEVHLRIEKECIPTRNTVCSCRPGYHCTLNVDGDCEQCAKHTVAPPGFQVIRSGTSLNDTHFIPCPPRTFSATEMSFSCEPWTNCSKVGMKEVQPGTAISDAICVCLCHDQVRTAILTSVFTVLLLCLLAVCVGIILWRRRKNSRKGAPREQQAEANGIYDPVPENDNPMTAPMQETAPHHGEPAYSVA